jgi:hypothetical protein
MRIISKFHDYYDSVMRMGMDKECIYLRDTKEIEIPKDHNDVRISGRRNKNQGDIADITRDKVIIGFCGNIYPLIIEKKEKDYCSPELIYHYKESEYTQKYIGRWYNTISFFDKDWSKYKKIFVDYKTPVFIILIIDRISNNNRSLLLNPRLSDYNFQSIKDPYTAYQDIYMYISGVLGINQKELIEISDKNRIEKHGFDKWSFRKKGKI